MLFNSYPFLLLFLPAAMLLYRFADPHPRLRIPVLISLSFAFYSYWYPPYIALLILSIVSNWLAARAYSATGRKGSVTLVIIADLAVLGVFKYTNFIAYNFGLLIGRPMPEFD